MMSEHVFVVNSPVLSCCGMPPGQCQCAQTDEPPLVAPVLNYGAEQTAGFEPNDSAAWDAMFRQDAERRRQQNSRGLRNNRR